ncbi:MAG: adenosylmethionine decarboxylase [Pseudomonadota bacterium]
MARIVFSSPGIDRRPVAESAGTPERTESPELHVVGAHYLLDLWGIHESALLDDTAALKTCLERAARRGGAKVLEATFRRFEPQGASGVVILAESHIAIHTWPELSFAALDVFTCGRPDIGEAIARAVIDELAPAEGSVRVVARSLPRDNRNPEGTGVGQ